MCGIFGILQRDPISPAILEKMGSTLRHRGPDDEGYLAVGREGIEAYGGQDTPAEAYQSDIPYRPKAALANQFRSDATLALGHRRLAIQDLSPLGHQPMSYRDRYWIAYNGEIYNHIELRAELQALGHVFISHSDTEVLLAAYVQWGVECLQRFNGMWAFALYDAQEKTLFLARDRFGVKPFYYYCASGFFVFASEIKALFCHPAVPKSANMDYLAIYLERGAQEYLRETAFSEIHRLDNAHYMFGNVDAIRSGQLQQQCYWKLEEHTPDTSFSIKTRETLTERYFALLEDAVRIRLRADVEIGSALSGGLDSSSIVYLINRIHAGQGILNKQVTFSTIYRGEGVRHCDESVFIGELAKELRVESNHIEPRMEDIPAEHARMIWHMDTPPDSTCMSAWHTFKLVQSRGIRVTLDGQGADEQLAGYTGYLSSDLIGLDFSEWIQAVRGYIGKYPPKAIVSQMPYALLSKMLGTRSTKFLTGKFPQPLRSKLEIGLLPLAHRLRLDSMTGLVTLLHYADHTSMAFSVESRMPFLDYRLAEFLNSVNQRFKLHEGWSKYLARNAFNKKLPDRIAWRRDKMGWPIPEDYWFSNDLKNWFVKNTNPSATALLRDLGPQAVHIAKNGALHEKIRLLNLNSWAETFLV